LENIELVLQAKFLDVKHHFLETRVKIQNKTFLNKVILLSSLGILTACGVSSNSASTTNRTENFEAVSVSFSPGELAKRQNQTGESGNNKIENFVATFESSNDNTVKFLYNSLSDPDPRIRKKGEELLINVLENNDSAINELKNLQAKNMTPLSWFPTKNVIEDFEKAKKKEKEAMLRWYLEEDKN
jgi:hypothetical protein